MRWWRGNSNLFGQLVGCNPISNLVGMVFIIGITPLSDIKMLMMCNTVFLLVGLKVPHSVTFLGE